MRCLIYANGKGTRWARGWETPKQLATIEGEPILHRLVKLFKDRGCDVTIVTGNKDFAVDGAELHDVGETRWLVETILKTKDLFDHDMTIVTFGDIYMSDWCADRFAEQTETQFFGRDMNSMLTGGNGEMWGCTVKKDDVDKFFVAVQAGLEDAEKTDAQFIEVIEKTGNRPFPFEPGAIWQVYNCYRGRHPQDGSMWHPGLWILVNDWTEDFDNPQHYEYYKSMHARRWLHDFGPPARIFKNGKIEDIGDAKVGD